VIAYRHASYATPVRAVPSRAPGRYHRGDEESATQYLCLHPLGPLAELMRAHSLRRPEQIREVRARTWALRMEIDSLPQITFRNAADFGIGAGALVDDDPSRCQALGARLRTEVPGLVVPSAALPGAQNVVLFGPRVAAPYVVEPIGAVDVAASITAEAGRPLLSLLAAVRFRGSTHAELEAWRTGRKFWFEEPDWAVA